MPLINNYRNDSINFMLMACISLHQDNILPMNVKTMDSSTIGSDIYPFFRLIQLRFQVSLCVSSILGFPEVMKYGKKKKLSSSSKIRPVMGWGQGLQKLSLWLLGSSLVRNSGYRAYTCSLCNTLEVCYQAYMISLCDTLEVSRVPGCTIAWLDSASSQCMTLSH